LGDKESARNQIKSAELEAERVALAVLERHGPHKEGTDALTVPQIAAINIANVRKHFSLTYAGDSADIQVFIDGIVALQSETS
jgi:hypothetical protein